MKSEPQEYRQILLSLSGMIKSQPCSREFFMIANVITEAEVLVIYWPTGDCQRPAHIRDAV